MPSGGQWPDSEQKRAVSGCTTQTAPPQQPSCLPAFPSHYAVDPEAEGTARISSGPFAHPLAFSTCFHYRCQNAPNTGQVSTKGKRMRLRKNMPDPRCQELPLTAREAMTWCPQSRGRRAWGLGTPTSLLPCCAEAQVSKAGV